MREIKSAPEKLIEKLKRRFPGAEMLENGDTYLGGYPGYFIVTNYTLRNLDFEMGIVLMQVFCIKGKKIYHVSFETATVQFETIYNEYQATLVSFNFR